MKTQNSPLLQLEGNSTHSRLPVERPIQLIARIAVVWLVLLASVGVSRAASGVWINDASSVWSATTNWSGGIVADGSGNTADFTMNNTNVDTVTMDASHSLGALLFGNNAGTTTNNNWILNASGGSVLTLAGGTPTITVSNGFSTNIVVAALPLAGTAGLTKAGNGTLILAGANSYTGNTTVSAGTLKLTNGIVGLSGTDPVLYMSFDNVSGATVINQGTGGSAMNGVLLGGAAIVPGGRYGKALSIPSNAQQGNSTPSCVLINNPVITMNINATTSWTLAMWIQSSTPGGCYFYQGNGGWAGQNTKFYLIQNTIDNDGPGTHAGGVSYARAWEQGTAVVADGNWHFVVFGSQGGTNIQYVDGVVDTMVQNQWSGSAGTTTQCRIGGGPTVSDQEVGLGGLIDEVYMFTNLLSQAQVTALMAQSSGPTDVASSMPATTTVSVAAPGKLDLNGNSPAIAGLTGIGTVDNTLGSPTLTINAGSDVEFDGIISNTTGTVSLTKIGNAKLTLGGTNIYNGATVVNAGTLNITGSLEPASVASSSFMAVRSGVVNFSGAFLTNYNFSIGTTTNLTGAFYQTAGILKQTQGGNSLDFQVGVGLFGYGYYYIGAGATNFCNEIAVGGEANPSGNGQVDINGTVINSGWIVVARGGSAQTAGIPQTGILNVWPGSSLSWGGQFDCNWGSGGAQTSIINLMGPVTLTSANNPLNLNYSGNAANTAILNLNAGGSIQAGWMPSSAAGTTRVNFNGGTLAATENQTVMMQGLTAATVYSGGGTFNNNGFAVTIGQQFLSPAGSGVNSISSFTPGAGYIAPPIVAVVSGDGNGVGATAVAQINPATGTVTNVLITCPGVNYTATPTFTLTGGNPTTPATITGAAPTPNATSGGMTFAGSGTTILTGGYTYTGPTLVVGGTLNLVSSTVTPSIAAGMIVSNATLTVDSSGGTVSLPVGNLTFLTNVTLNIVYGTVLANPANPAINVSGIFSTAPTNLISITALGLKPGVFTLIKYTGTLPSIANIGLNPPPGVTATLVNNPLNHSIELNVSSAPKQLTWYGSVSTNWNTTTVNWTNIADGTATVYQQYTNSTGVIIGDGVIFDDTLYNDGVNPQPTNINLTSTFYPYPVTVDSTLPYSFAGVGGITGPGYLIQTNTGSLTMLTSNSFTGGLSINGGSVIITNDSALGANASVVTLNGGALQVNGNTTNNARVFSVPATSSIGVINNVTARFGGAVTGPGGLTKIDNGTLVLAGANGITGNLLVRQGTLNTAGANTLPAVVTVGDTAGLNGVLNILAGTFRANNNGGQFTSSLIVGSVSGAAGEIALNGGSLTVAQQLGLGTGVGGYAGFTMSGGTFTNGSYIVVGFNNDTAVYNQNGGTALVTSNLMTIAAGGTAAIGQANIFGGTFTSAGTGGGIMVGERGTGTMNVSGAASVIVTNNGLTIGPVASQSGWSGTLNLLGGTITANRVAKGLGTGTAFANFNGGTLKASVANTTFMTGLNGATVYNGGLTVDDGGNAITIPQPLLGAGGVGVGAITLATGGSGYIDSPIVTISGGTGSNTMVVAQVNPVSGTVTNLVISCPGSGYTLGDGLSLSFSGGGVSTVAPTIGTVSFISNGTGGLTKKGSGTTILTGVNTFGGPIAVIAGTLSLNSASTYAGTVNVNAGTLATTTASKFTGSTTVTNGATFTATQIGSATNSMGNLTIGVTAAPGATLGLGLTGLNPTVPLVNCGTLTFNGTNTISVAGSVNVGSIPLVKYVGAIAGLGTYTNITLPQGVVGFISNSAPNSTLYAVITSTGPGLVWTGANTNNLWDISSTTNWLLGATPTTYQQPIIPGDAVTFNDSGSGTVILNTNAGPSSLVISNNSKSYTFGGRGNITGPGGLTKLGSGTAILNLTNNNYAGDTVVSNGTLVVGNASALSSAANLNVGPSGTLDLAGFSEPINGLSGSGTINNSGATASVLTMGNANGGGTWSGTIAAGVGGSSFIKVGGGNSIITGTNNLASAAASQVNGGTMLITNGGTLNLSGGAEFWVMQNAGTASVTVDGGTLLVNNWLVVGRNAAGANGTLIVNSGLVQKTGGGNVVVGSLNATGTLIVNGGQLLNNSELWLGENPAAVAILRLNGGLLQASDIRGNNQSGGFPTTLGVAYFNGGTLQASASSADFLQGTIISMVMSNGLILDDGGFTLSIGASALQMGDAFNGGLVKQGAGTVYLDAANYYHGTTLVTNGTLAGIGSINSPMIVRPAGNLGAGDAGATVGTFTVYNNLTLQGNATLRIDKTGGSPVQDNVTVSDNITYGGILTVTNITSDANLLTTTNTFQLFSVSGSTSGNFTSIVGSPGAGLAYSFTPASGVLSVVTGTTIASNPTNITFSVSGSTLSLSWPADHLGWILQSQTNSLSTGISPNWFDVPGSASSTSAVINMNPANATVFYRLRHP
jgi:autotransporter-associated beta strand protein